MKTHRRKKKREIQSSLGEFWKMLQKIGSYKHWEIRTCKDNGRAAGRRPQACMMKQDLGLVITSGSSLGLQYHNGGSVLMKNHLHRNICWSANVVGSKWKRFRSLGIKAHSSDQPVLSGNGISIQRRLSCLERASSGNHSEVWEFSETDCKQGCSWKYEAKNCQALIM